MCQFRSQWLRLACHRWSKNRPSPLSLPHFPVCFSDQERDLLSKKSGTFNCTCCHTLDTHVLAEGMAFSMSCLVYLEHRFEGPHFGAHGLRGRTYRGSVLNAPSSAHIICGRWMHIYGISMESNCALRRYTLAFDGYWCHTLTTYLGFLVFFPSFPSLMIANRHANDPTRPWMFQVHKTKAPCPWRCDDLHATVLACIGMRRRKFFGRVHSREPNQVVESSQFILFQESSHTLVVPSPPPPGFRSPTLTGLETRSASGPCGSASLALWAPLPRGASVCQLDSHPSS